MQRKKPGKIYRFEEHELECVLCGWFRMSGTERTPTGAKICTYYRPTEQPGFGEVFAVCDECVDQLAELRRMMKAAGE